MDRVRKIINAGQAWEKGYYGEEVGVAVLDTGIYPHPDFEHRIVCFRDYVRGRNSLYDDNGHGTHIAGIIGGDGGISNGKYMGLAPPFITEEMEIQSMWYGPLTGWWRTEGLTASGL